MCFWVHALMLCINTDIFEINIFFSLLFYVCAVHSSLIMFLMLINLFSFLFSFISFACVFVSHLNYAHSSEYSEQSYSVPRTDSFLEIMLSGCHTHAGSFIQHDNSSINYSQVIHKLLPWLFDVFFWFICKTWQLKCIHWIQFLCKCFFLYIMLKIMKCLHFWEIILTSPSPNYYS